jgi:hypothetical protein
MENMEELLRATYKVFLRPEINPDTVPLKITREMGKEEYLWILEDTEFRFEDFAPPDKFKQSSPASFPHGE